MDLGDTLNEVANLGIKNQVVKDTDYYDEEGLLVCGKCGKSKQTRIDVFHPDGSSTKLLVVCLCDCEMEIQRKKEIAFKKSQDMVRVERLRGGLMDKRTKESTFENFKIDKYNEKVLGFCKAYVEDFDNMVKENQGMLFWGDVGTGKSFAAACIANALMDKGEPVIMTSFVRLLELIQKGEEIDYGILTSARLVIFDDFGAERSTDYALEKVYKVLDDRYRAKLPMIVTTNIELQEMKESDDVRYKRIYQRIIQGCYPVHFTGKNWRMVEAGKRFEAMKKWGEGL